MKSDGFSWYSECDTAYKIVVFSGVYTKIRLLFSRFCAFSGCCAFARAALLPIVEIIMTVVRVILPVPLTQTFDYLLPDNLPCPVAGARVIVPFGRQKQAVGIVAELAESSTFSPKTQSGHRVSGR